MTQPLEIHREDAERDAETSLDEALDTLITLVDATSSPDTGRVVPRHLFGAFTDLVEENRATVVTEEVDPSAAALDFFNALDELIDLGYLSLSVEGYGLTELGKERASLTHNTGLNDVAEDWRV